jgi:hypothetical protein
MMNGQRGLAEYPHAEQRCPDDGKSNQNDHPHIFFFHDAFSPLTFR